MNAQQWQDLLLLTEGKKPSRTPIGFIIDSPWLPGWYGISTLQYYTSDELWFAANKKAIETFPEVMFLPGFWSEYGMCSEPSAFGAKQVWYASNLPHADKVILEIDDIKKLKKPNPATDGMLPFILQRLISQQPRIREMGHEIKFAFERETEDEDDELRPPLVPGGHLVHPVVEPLLDHAHRLRRRIAHAPRHQVIEIGD